MSNDDIWTTVAKLALAGNMEELSTALQSLKVSHLHAAFQLSFKLGFTDATFALLQWVCAQMQPAEKSPSLNHWLYAHNNALHTALRLDQCPPNAEALVVKSLALAPLNPPIYQNAAGVYCRLGKRDQAMEVVRQAVDATVDGLASFAEDPDLASLHEDPEFRNLLAPALRVEDRLLNDALVPWRERFASEPPPEWVNIIRQLTRGQPLPSGIFGLIESSEDAQEGDFQGVATTWVCRGAREESGRAGYAPALGDGVVVFVDGQNGTSWAAPSLWAGLRVLAESAHNSAHVLQSLVREAKNYQWTLPTSAEAKLGVLESSAALAELLSRTQDEGKTLIALRALALEAAEPESAQVYVLRPSARPWHRSVARIGGPAAVDSWPTQDNGAPMAHLMTLDLEACPLLRNLDPSLSQVRALSVFVGPDHWGLRESACVLSEANAAPIADGTAAERSLAAVLRPRRELCWEALEVPVTVLGPPQTSWTLEQTRLADALAMQTCLRSTPNGAELCLRPEDVGLRPQRVSRQTRMYRLTVDGLEEVRIRRPSEDLIDGAGAPLVLRSDLWTDLAKGPFSALEQLLMRMCFLAKEHFELGFVLDGERVAWSLGEQQHVVDLDTSSVGRAIEDLLEELNTFLETAGVGFRFVTTPRRVLLVSRAWDAHLVAAKVIDDMGYGDEASSARGPLPTLPKLSEFLPPERVFARDASYASLLSRHLEEMATHFGLDELSVAPRFMRPNEGGRMRLSMEGPMMSGSPSVVGTSVSDVAPLIHELNDYTNAEESGRQIYEYRIGIFDKGALFASPEEAEALRQAGWLVEDWRQDWVRETLGKQGIELSHFWGVREVVKLGRQMAALMSEEASFSVSQEGDEATLAVAGKTLTLTLTNDQERWETALVALARGVNGLLAKASKDLNDKRWVLFEGEYDRRLVFVTKAWAKTLAELSTMVQRSLEDGFTSRTSSRLPIAYPRPCPTLETPSVPSVRRLVPKRRILSSDFKCSGRTTDYPELVDGLAAHAELDVSVEPYARESRDPWEYFVYASFDGVQTEIAMGSSKYADLTPVLEYLNGLLAQTGSERRLCFYSQPPWDDGVLFIDRDEAETLAAFQIAYWPGEKPE